MNITPGDLLYVNGLASAILLLLVLIEAARRVLGATVQAQFRCTVRGKEIEKPAHCGTSAHHLRGFPWLRNDAVNLLSTFLAVVLAAAFFFGGSAFRLGE